MIRHRRHILRRVEHPGFGKDDVKIVGYGIELRFQGIYPYGKNSLNAKSILRRDGRDGAGPVQTQNGKRLEVGLDSGTATRI
jgi:hypothetical protein